MAGLELRSVGASYDGKVALSGVDLVVPPGETLAVLGPSGCGKSTLLRVVAGLEPATGQVRFDDQDLAGVPTHRRGFALMFQDGQLFPQYTVAANVGYALGLRGVSRAAASTRVAELLDLVGLPGYADRLPGSLSGGERQRVALARALAVEPRLLLLDEPLSSLDGVLRERLAGDLRKILTDTGTPAIVVTHDRDEAFALADRLALLRAGKLVQEGRPANVWRAPADEEAAAFLGYPTVLAPDEARWLFMLSDLPSGGTRPLALRRAALRETKDGPLRATVLASRPGPERTTIEVALADLAGRTALAIAVGETPAIGAVIRLTFDPTFSAEVGPGPESDSISGGRSTLD